jgi:AraC-like DNA-binding protein
MGLQEGAGGFAPAKKLSDRAREALRMSRFAAPRVDGATRAINFRRRPTKQILENGMEARLGPSVRQFARAFKESMSLTPHQFVLRRRIERAKMLLDPDPPDQRRAPDARRPSSRSPG